MKKILTLISILILWCGCNMIGKHLNPDFFIVSEVRETDVGCFAKVHMYQTNGNYEATYWYPTQCNFLRVGDTLKLVKR